MSPKRPSKLTADQWFDLVARYKTPAFIADDPLQFPHRYRESGTWQDAELVALLAAVFSYGSRPLICQMMETALKPLGKAPVSVLINASPAQRKRWSAPLTYRFYKPADLDFLFSRLAHIYQDHGSLKALWQRACDETNTLAATMSQFRAQLYGPPAGVPARYGTGYLLPDTRQGGAAKRLAMFLRWMVRSDEVDLGLWADTLPASRLIMPLDTHVVKTAQRFGLTTRQTPNWAMAEEITTYFRTLCPEDPVQFDFALFGLGVSADRAPAARPTGKRL